MASPPAAGAGAAARCVRATGRARAAAPTSSPPRTIASSAPRRGRPEPRRISRGAARRGGGRRGLGGVLVRGEGGTGRMGRWGRECKEGEGSAGAGRMGAGREAPPPSGAGRGLPGLGPWLGQDEIGGDPFATSTAMCDVAPFTHTTLLTYGCAFGGWGGGGHKFLDLAQILNTTRLSISSSQAAVYDGGISQESKRLEGGSPGPGAPWTREHH